MYQDSITQRGYCTVCAASEITSTQNVHLQFLSDLMQYEVGERVECWTMGEFYEGFGEVKEISTELRDGGTPVHPAYLVQIDDREGPLWFTPICLKRARSEVNG